MCLVVCVRECVFVGEEQYVRACACVCVSMY